MSMLTSLASFLSSPAYPSHAVQAVSSNGWPPDVLQLFLALAQQCLILIEQPRCYEPVLQGKTVANLFFEASTRTRSSFELAAKSLGATVLNFEVKHSSLSKGETVLDTVDTLVQMGVHAVVVRHGDNGLPQLLADTFPTLKVINAGDGNNDHPTQGLLDLFTMLTTLPNRELALAQLKGKKLAIVGDVNHSRVARANLRLLAPLGVALHLAAPATLADSALASEFTCTVHHTLEPALQNADFVMALRLQKERMAEGLLPSLEAYIEPFQLSEERLLHYCKPSVRFLHPGPVNREVEVTGALVDHPQLSLVRQQVRHGVAVRMAVLLSLLYEPF
jgi:aspartate carbamoyltransferase catalytic subunit